MSNQKKILINPAWIIIGLGFLFRCIYARCFLLVPDETNYWQWARHLAWGYHDQAPLIGWAIHATTALLGSTELGVRLPSILAMTLASIYVFLIARRWFNERVAFQAVLLSQAILVFNIGAVLATADGLQGVAWAAASYHTARAFEDNEWCQWGLGGIWFGLGMLSKYTMVLFLPCVLFFAVFSKHHRKSLLQFRPYIACLFGFSFFIPVILWNAANHWNSLRHVAHIGGADEPFYSIHFAFLVDYVGSQAALLTPLVFVLTLLAWIHIIRGKSVWGHPWIYRFLLFTSLPVIAGFAFLSLHSRVYGNWPCAGYTTVPILIAAFWGRRPRSERKEKDKSGSHLWFWTLGTAFGLTALLLAHVIWPVLPIPSNLDRTVEETVGWDILGRRVGEVYQDMLTSGPAFIFGLKYQMASELAFYTPGQPQTVAINRWDRPNVYDYWWTDEQLMGSNAIGVIPEGDAGKRLLKVFEKVDAPEPFVVYRPNLWKRWTGRSQPKPVKHYFIYRCYGFKGGLRWIPSSKHDIRYP